MSQPEYESEEIGHFSSDDNGDIYLDQRFKTYFISPDPRFIGYDLHTGFDSHEADDYKPWDHDLRLILQWIVQKKPLLHGIEFVTRRKLLTKISLTPCTYQNHKWSIIAVYFEGKYYLSEKESVYVTQDPKRDYQGFNFERIATSTTVGGMPDTEGRVRSGEVYCHVLKGQLNCSAERKHTMLFCAETDCCDENEKAVELKTHIFSQNRKIPNPMWFTVKNWWLQAKFGGINNMVTGYVTPEGDEMRLTSIIQKTSEELFKECGPPSATEQGAGQGGWDKKCFNYLAEFLSEVKRQVTADQPCALFTYSGSGNFQYSPLNPEEHPLPRWYTEAHGEDKEDNF